MYNILEPLELGRSAYIHFFFLLKDIIFQMTFYVSEL